MRLLSFLGRLFSRPRPTVRCCDCGRFVAESAHPDRLGICDVGHDWQWPLLRRRCSWFQPKDKTQKGA